MKLGTRGWQVAKSTRKYKYLYTSFAYIYIYIYLYIYIYIYIYYSIYIDIFNNAVDVNTLHKKAIQTLYIFRSVYIYIFIYIYIYIYISSTLLYVQCTTYIVRRTSQYLNNQRFYCSRMYERFSTTKPRYTDMYIIV